MNKPLILLRKPCSSVLARRPLGWLVWKAEVLLAVRTRRREVVAIFMVAELEGGEGGKRLRRVT